MKTRTHNLKRIPPVEQLGPDPERGPRFAPRDGSVVRPRDQRRNPVSGPATRA